MLREKSNQQEKNMLFNVNEEKKEEDKPSNAKGSKVKPEDTKAKNNQHAETSMFECNICLEQATEPVVTQCGHLYCWKCIYEWMQQPRETLVCPVCKSGINKETIIPIFTKENNQDPRKKQGENIPNRPGARRSEPHPNQNYNQSGFSWMGSQNPGVQSQGFVMGLGLFPALFTLNFSWDDIFGPNRAA